MKKIIMKIWQNCSFKDNVRIQEHRMITSAIKKQTSVCCSTSLKEFSHRKLIYDMLFPLKSPLQYGEIPFQY